MARFLEKFGFGSTEGEVCNMGKDEDRVPELEIQFFGTRDGMGWQVGIERDYELLDALRELGELTNVFPSRFYHTEDDERSKKIARGKAAFMAGFFCNPEVRRALKNKDEEMLRKLASDVSRAFEAIEWKPKLSDSTDPYRRILKSIR